jgi:hypothetical protein
LLIFVPKIVRWKSKSGNQPSRFSTNTRWSQSPGNNASRASAYSQQEYASRASAHSQQECDTPTMNRAASSASEVKSKYVKQVTFADKESELVYREKLDEIIDLVMEEHKIDIASIILKIKRADEAVPVTGEDDAQPESTVVESA